MTTSPSAPRPTGPPEPSAGEGAGEADPRRLRRVALASLVGTSIEWYDFYIYGLAAIIVFGPQFFPGASTLAATLAAFGTFAVGFVARPIGGVIFGHLGDKLGRKNTLVATLLTMGISTALIGLLPTYATIGVAAPILLVLLRVLQGFAVGGEWGGAVLISVEHAPEKRRGFFGAFPQLGVPIGLIAANGAFLLLAAVVSPEALTSWAWRVPFLFSALLVGVGLYVRLKVEESPEFERSERAGSMRLPIVSVLREHSGQVLCGILIFGGITAVGYIAAVFSISYGTSQLDLPRAPLLAIVLVVALIELPLTLWFSQRADTWGLSRTVAWGAVATAVAIAAFLPLMASGSLLLIALAVAAARIASDVMWGPSAALAAQSYPPEVRYSGASVGYQLGSIFGGALAPIVVTLLLASSVGMAGASVYLVVMVALSGVGALGAAKLSRRSHAAGVTGAGGD
ncbi:putative MFS family arabinose efflux permease [Pseudonocardia sediminis]|uniref:Putative proline/betaine transporter n=1 Tax=Pseudonocardia sediminis TaxID=1397368 RepID=A0A4Q7UXM7_PSEST|nr:MFS transporter [Pseudonocardia sediminis]RZT86782.1 putative MFS family arabinose efflux permease [Pseudonocardia sediminis]